MLRGRCRRRAHPTSGLANGGAGYTGRMSPEDPTSLRADAYDLFMAEAARVRLLERAGQARVILRSGVVLSGQLRTADDESVLGLLDLLTDDGRRLRVSSDAVTALVGASAALRDESGTRRATTLTTRLRETWAAGSRIRTLLRDAGWIEGVIVLVAADHVELLADGERWVIPFGAVDAWDLAEAA